jgi:L-rhamnose mutarotase
VKPQRFSSVIRLRVEREAEYRRLHAEVWPEVQAALRAARITNYSTFQRDGLLLSYLEYSGDDYRPDTARIAADPATQRWWTLTDPCQQPLDKAGEGQWWTPSEEAFPHDLDNSPRHRDRSGRRGADPRGPLKTDWEVELAVLIGRASRHLDVSEGPAERRRRLRHQQRHLGAGISAAVRRQWDKGKNCETCNLQATLACHSRRSARPASSRPWPIGRRAGPARRSDHEHDRRSRDFDLVSEPFMVL